MVEIVVQKFELFLERFRFRPLRPTHSHGISNDIPVSCALSTLLARDVCSSVLVCKKRTRAEHNVRVPGDGPG
jgi:hypothetical protein